MNRFWEGLIFRKPIFGLILVFTLMPFFSCLKAQNFPKLGNDTLLDVACWNVEWLGNTSNGPTDEATQYNNVKALLDRTDLDVFALEEISDANTYNNLSNALASKYDTYLSTYSQTQKTGIFWRKNMFSVVGALTYNIPLNSSENYAFASRPPLQVCLQTIGGTQIDTLYFLVLHMKAQTESTDAGRLESYTRRKNASIALKSYLETSLASKKYIVLGDWNDDLDFSIYNNLETPYKNFLQANYTFPSEELTKSGKSSYAFNTNMIDHLLNSKSLDSFYYTGSARVFDNAATYCTGFSNNTSDHYPVYAFYNWQKLTTRVIPEGGEDQIELGMVRIYPNPVSERLFVECDFAITQIRLIELTGKIIHQTSENSERVTFQTIGFSKGIYLLQIESEKGVVCKKITLE